MKTCRRCGGKLQLRVDRGRSFLRCSSPSCPGHDARGGGRPLRDGSGDAALASARQAAHKALDRLWKRHGWERDEAYTWLATTLGRPRDQVHIGNLDAPTCWLIVGLCERVDPADRPAGKEEPRRPQRQEPPPAPAKPPRSLQEAKEQDSGGQQLDDLSDLF